MKTKTKPLEFRINTAVELKGAKAACRELDRQIKQAQQIGRGLLRLERLTERGMIRLRCTVSTGSGRNLPKLKSARGPSGRGIRTLHVNPGTPRRAAALKNLESLSGKLPASLLRPGR